MSEIKEKVEPWQVLAANEIICKLYVFSHRHVISKEMWNHIDTTRHTDILKRTLVEMTIESAMRMAEIIAKCKREAEPVEESIP